MKKIIAVLLTAIMLFSFSACDNIAEQEFSKDGMTIKLTSEFIEKSYENYTVCYESKNIIVMVIKEDFNSFEGFGDYTVAQYAELMKLSCTQEGRLPTDITVTDGITNFEYSTYRGKDQEGEPYKYFTAMYKGDDAFWTVQFATLLTEYELYKARILEYAKTVDVSQSIAA